MVASLVAEPTGSWAPVASPRDLGSRGFQALEPGSGSVIVAQRLSVPQHVESSRTRAGAVSPALVGSLSHWTSR